ncbi:MAG: N-6 DNA methylase [Actinobacteria bacterium]|nr:N-6 DNA methylase [Actinomycetota bacterium]
MHEALLARAHRHRRGVFYTPAAITMPLTELALEHIEGGSAKRPTVCDPACGGGAFLLAAARHLDARGLPPHQIVEDVLWGVDIDPLAAAVAEAALCLWAVVRGAPVGSANIAVGDSLRDQRPAGPAAPDRFDAVIGNPPFQNQLGTSTARSPLDIDRLRRRFGSAVQAYADTATLFLVHAVELTRPGGRAALLQPLPFLMARDAAAAREHVLRHATLIALWHCPDLAFDAGVRVCAPVLELPASSNGSGGTGAPLRRFEGEAFEPRDPRPWRRGEPACLTTWSPLVADLFGVPPVTIVSRGTLEGWCRATAGFRDQYYGLVGHVLEEGDADPSTSRTCRLVTAGLIDPGRTMWGERPTKFAGERWLEPAVCLDELDDRLRAWASDLLVPKVLIATQTRVLEAAVDERGEWYPSVPVIALVPHDPGRVWHAAAVALAPPVSAWAWANFAGGALSADAIKLAARDVLSLPTPTHDELWDQGAALAREVSRADSEEASRGALQALGRVMCDAYTVDGDDVLAWWLRRLPRRRVTSRA